MASSPVEICDLPDEILCEIFSKLTPEEIFKFGLNVCKRWNAILNGRKRFWEHIQVTVHCDYFINCSYFDERAERPYRGGSYSSPLGIFPSFLLIGDKDLGKVSGLRYIKLIHGSKTDWPAQLLIRILDILSKTCNNIESFEFSQCFGATSKEFFQFLRKRYSQISEVRFDTNCTYIIPYKEISKFSNITTIVSHDYSFKRSDLNLLAENCETLSCLWILFSRSPKVDDILHFLDKKKHVLKELGLGVVLEDCILEKLKECHQLEVFFATDARHVTDSCMKSFTNLPRLKYCSLHRTKFELETVWAMVNGTSPRISTQLLILDLSGYKKVREVFNNLQIFLKNESTKKLEEGKFVTFDNDTNTAIKHSWFANSSFHWMYRNETVMRDYRFWKNYQH